MRGVVNTFTLRYLPNIDSNPATQRSEEFTFNIEEEKIDFVFWGSPLVEVLKTHVDSIDSRTCTLEIRNTEGSINSTSLGKFGDSKSMFQTLENHVKSSENNIVFLAGFFDSTESLRLRYYLIDSAKGIGVNINDMNTYGRVSATSITRGECWVKALQAKFHYQAPAPGLVPEACKIVNQDQFITKLYSNGKLDNLEVLSGFMFVRPSPHSPSGAIAIMEEHYRREGDVEIKNPMTRAALRDLLPQYPDVSKITSELAKAIIEAKRSMFGVHDWQEPVMKKSGPCPIKPVKLNDPGNDALDNKTQMYLSI